MPSQRKKKKRQVIDVTKWDSLQQLNLNAAGLDLGAAEIWACVPEERVETSVRVFETFAVDLHALADWLEECGVETVCALRAYVRHRDNLIRYRSVHIQHMQKALQQMNVQLTNVISDITGVTGLKIIRAIVAGEQPPLKLAQFRDDRCKRLLPKI